MRWENFNEMLNETYPYDGEKMDYEIRCPALDVSFDNGGNCRCCRTFTVNVMTNPNWTRGKKNDIFNLTYDLLRPKPRICSRQCLFDYINANYDKILERLTT